MRPAPQPLVFQGRRTGSPSPLPLGSLVTFVMGRAIGNSRPWIAAGGSGGGRLPHPPARSPCEEGSLPRAGYGGWRGRAGVVLFRPSPQLGGRCRRYICSKNCQSRIVCFSSCGSTETRRGTLTALKSLASSGPRQQRTARRRAAAAAAGSLQATLAFLNSRGRGLRRRAAAAAAARGRLTPSGARRTGGRARGLPQLGTRAPR